MAAEPPPIEPDTKDWTWVLETTCPDCGFDAEGLDVATTGKRVRAVAERFADLLDDPLAGRRPDPGQWSAVEYACHVRDVFRLFDLRLHLMLDEDDPLFANWDQDVTAIDDDYASQSADVVAREIVEAASIIAASFEAVTPDQQTRVGRRSDGARFTVDSFTRYFLHDPVHHLWDVAQGYERMGDGD